MSDWHLRHQGAYDETGMSTLAEIFTAALSRRVGRTVAELDRFVADMFAEIAAAWPDLPQPPPDDFVVELARRASSGQTVQLDRLRQLHLGDLYLAHLCLGEHPAAVPLLALTRMYNAVRFGPPGIGFRASEADALLRNLRNSLQEKGKG